MASKLYMKEKKNYLPYIFRYSPHKLANARKKSILIERRLDNLFGDHKGY